MSAAATTAPPGDAPVLRRRLTDQELYEGGRFVDPQDSCHGCFGPTDALGSCVGVCAGEVWDR